MKKSTISLAVVLLILSNVQKHQAPVSRWVKIDTKGQVWQSRDGINWITSSTLSIYKLADGSMLWKQDLQY